MKCPHLESGNGLAKHSELAFRTVPPDENTTDYVWQLDYELCVLCSGIARGAISELERYWRAEARAGWPLRKFALGEEPDDEPKP